MALPTKTFGRRSASKNLLPTGFLESSGAETGMDSVRSIKVTGTNIGAIAIQSAGGQGTIRIAAKVTGLEILRGMKTALCGGDFGAIAMGIASGKGTTLYGIKHH